MKLVLFLLSPHVLTFLVKIYPSETPGKTGHVLRVVCMIMLVCISICGRLCSSLSFIKVIHGHAEEKEARDGEKVEKKMIVLHSRLYLLTWRWRRKPGHSFLSFLTISKDIHDTGGQREGEERLPPLL